MKWFKKLLFWYLVFVIVKSLFSYFVPSPSAFSDSYFYFKMAENFFYHLNFLEYNLSYPPLYPIVISLAYIFKNKVTVYFIIKIINAVISSLVIFPAWLLSKEFMDKTKALKISILVSLTPLIFSFSPYIMSENLFSSLFLFSFYFIYKSFTSKKYKWDVLAGIFIGLIYLTKTTGVTLILSLISFIIIDIFYKKNTLQIKKKSILFFFLLITISPLLVKNIINFGFFSAFLGRYITGLIEPVSAGFPYIRIIPRFFLILGYTILGSFVIYFMTLPLLFKKFKNNYKLFVLTTFSLTSISIA